jgi:phospholipase/lecithinase/hemolysin
LAVIFALLALPALSSASPFSSVVVYGDSLSDNGNLFALAGLPGPPYFEGRRSNGPVAVEQLAAALGSPLVDFAWIGATSGIGNYADNGTTTSTGFASLPGMQTELAGSQGSLGPFLAGGLFIVWGGANDFLAPSPLDTTPQDTVNRGVADIVGIVTTLRGLGAQNILVPGMPDLGLTPSYRAQGPIAAAGASVLTDAFNTQLQASLPSGVDYYDTAALLRSMVANPATYGFSNVTDACLVGTTVCADPGKYLFWDDFHPTTATASFVSAGFQQTVVPEPATFVLLLSALALLVPLRRRLVR